MNKLIRLAVVAVFAFAVTGCATVNKMAFDKATATLDTKEKSIVLMTVDVSRSDGSRWVPEAKVAKLEKSGAQNKEDRQNFSINKDVDAVQVDGQSIYLVRMALIPGDYTFHEIFGMASAFPIHGMFTVPVGTDLNVKPNSVVYIGRITAKLRARVGEEFRAGPLLPLIDQAIAGMSGNTWDVSIDDLAQKDLTLFRNNFPVLKDVAIDTAPLPAFDRAAAQRRWDGDNKEKAQTATTANTSPGNKHATTQTPD
ncbi:hypothetical protein [Massilia sp. NR 4-1]|uniref:hypothetical protein n=1 Tax=Massilia sp. NR 4-1 TaxID=1678028 RepID=UPI00067AB7C8|nr:hypothetical protein [Massilia sp. NR 4-1]